MSITSRAAMPGALGGPTVIDALLRRAVALAESSDRVIIGITGCPGAGKTTLAEDLVARLDPGGPGVAHVPMDGFHLADATLDRLGRRDRKGAVDTFDAFGYLALLRRLHYERSHTVFAPGFERTLEQPIAAAIGVDPQVRLVITEGIYLLVEEAPWPDIRRELAEVWYVHLEDEERRARLVARHVAFGKSGAAARQWVEAVDEPNARLIAPGRARADLIVDMAGRQPVAVPGT